MQDYLLDTSVLLKWFHTTGEGEIEPAQWHLEAHREGVIRAHTLDLGLYELGNVLLRPLRRTDLQTAQVIRAARELCGPPLTLSPEAFTTAAQIAFTDELTFYDAAFAAAALQHDCTLLSADQRLIASGHAITLTESLNRQRNQTQKDLR